MSDNIIKKKYTLIKTEKKLIGGVETIIVYYARVKTPPIEEITFDFILEKDKKLC